MRVLQIGPKEKEAIASCIRNAEKHRIPLSEMKKRAAGEGSPVGDNPDFICYVTDGYRVAYSIEEQPVGWCRHISVSVDTPKKLPHIGAFEMIMGEFGFRGGVQDCDKVWVKEITDTLQAVNAVQRYEIS